MKNGKRLQNFHVDLAFAFMTLDGNSRQEAIERLVNLFGEEIRVSSEALRKRLQFRKKKIANNTWRGLTYQDAASLSDEDLLSYARSHMYLHTYAAAVRQDANELRKNVDVLMRILKAKKELVGTDEADKKAAEFIRMLRGVEEENNSLLVN